ncbi:hypothetical protein [Flavisericum labens]|uniref:hypothetical protein n=1 Tax=Flavisericum labens TaxID=3377112 RepID=UPI00387AFF02
MENLKVLIIHDDLSPIDPIVITLKEIYGEENVVLEPISEKGIEYIEQNLTSKLIVLLDFDLGTGHPDAPVVFKKIREKTSLVYVIIWTAKLLSEISREDLIDFINNDALAFVQNTESTETVINLVAKAAHQLESRVDCILEEWISKREKDELEKPYLTTKSGKIYTLADLMVEIRLETDLGRQMKKSILLLAIDLLTTQQRQLDD